MIESLGGLRNFSGMQFDQMGMCLRAALMATVVMPCVGNPEQQTVPLGKSTMNGYIKQCFINFN